MCVNLMLCFLSLSCYTPTEYSGPMMDTTSVYVRGEENLRGWRPRRESLIYEHKEQLEKLKMIEEVMMNGRLVVVNPFH